jgi:succinate dehydrogenase / fumarate reductase cytochrome b subunit
VLLFLVIHIVDMSFAYFAPHLLEDVLNLYRTTIFGLGEMALVFCLFFHGVNGLRIAYLDMFASKNWTIEKTRKSAVTGLVIAVVLWVPAALYMFYNLLRHNYGLFGG